MGGKSSTNQLNADLNQAREEVKIMNQRLSDATEQLAKVRADLDAAPKPADVTRLENALRTVRGELTTCTQRGRSVADVVHLENELTKLRNDLTTSAQSAATCHTGVARLEADLAGLRGELATCSQRATNCTATAGQVALLQAEVARVQGLLTAATNATQGAVDTYQEVRQSVLGFERGTVMAAILSRSSNGTGLYLVESLSEPICGAGLGPVSLCTMSAMSATPSAGTPAPLLLQPTFDPRVFGSDDGRFALYVGTGAINWTEGNWLIMDDNGIVRTVRGYPSRTPGAAWLFSTTATVVESITAPQSFFPILQLWNDLLTPHSGTGAVVNRPTLRVYYDSNTKQVKGLSPTQPMPQGNWHPATFLPMPSDAN